MIVFSIFECWVNVAGDYYWCLPTTVIPQHLGGIDWFHDPLGHQNPRMLKFPILDGAVFAYNLYLHKATAGYAYRDGGKLEPLHHSLHVVSVSAD